MKDLLNKYKYIILTLGVIVGAAGGYLYYYYVGCQTGTCPITSRWYNSSLYGAVLGGLLFNMFLPQKKSK